MKPVPVSQLKASLSSYLDIVKSGEEVVVSDRGRPIARLVPIDRRDGSDQFVRLERSGQARLPKKKMPSYLWKSVPETELSEGTLTEMMMNEREEDER